MSKSTKRTAQSHIVSANDLMVGDVVYFTAAGGWTRLLDEAAVAEDADAGAALLKRAEAQADRIVGAYLAAVDGAADGLRLVATREQLRDLGPSNRPDLGRQAGEGLDARVGDLHRAA